MKILFELFLMLIAINTNAQERYVYVEGNYKYIQWGESHYSNDLDGLVAMMKDVEMEDSFLYEKLAYLLSGLCPDAKCRHRIPPIKQT